jgi:hypothetical protein
MKNKFYEELKTVAAEKDVEEKYKNEFKNNLKELDKISSPHKTDGIMEFVQCFDGVDKIKVLMEFKYKWNFSNSIEQAKALIQSLFYIKEIEQSGETIPDVVFVADENECFLAPVIDLIGFLSNESIDWKDLVDEFTGFKNFEGQFVMRRISAFKRKFTKDNWHHLDDISIASIHV